MVSVSRKAAVLGLFLVICLSLLLCASAASSTANLKAQAKVCVSRSSLSDPALQCLLSTVVLCLSCVVWSFLTVQAQATGWEVTLERQKLRAQALADEFGALIEYGARKVLGEADMLKLHYIS